MRNDVEMKRFAESVANKNKWHLNPDNDFYLEVLRGLAKNEERYGFFLCPCRDSWGVLDKDRDIKCPCAYAEADILEYNRCYCGLFVKQGSSQSDIDRPVEDRRPDELYPD